MNDQGAVLRAVDRLPVMIFDTKVKPQGGTHEEKAMEYIRTRWNNLGFKDDSKNVLNYELTRRMNSETIVYYRQTYKGLRVDKNEVSVHLTNHGEVGAFLNSTFSIRSDLSVTPKLSREVAFEKVKTHLKASNRIRFEKSELMIHMLGLTPYLCWQVNIIPHFPQGDWVAFVDARTGTLLELRNISSPYHPESVNVSGSLSKEKSETCTVHSSNKSGKRKHSPSNSLVLLDGTGRVFSPAPTISAKEIYGAGGFVDGGDATNAVLDEELMDVTLRDITNDGGVYKLIGPNAEVDDPNGVYDSATPDFSFDRDHPSFEAVMCYFYLDQAMDYVNNGVLPPGTTIGPSAGGGVVFEPHELGTANNAKFETSTERLLFGDGGDNNAGDVVDSGEDATIILHEFGHAIHHWLTMGNANAEQGIGEGLGDYWGASNTHDCANSVAWDEWEPEYHNTHHWGLLPFIAPRTTNYTMGYLVTQNNPNEIHTYGQHLATALMRIHRDLGKEKTDFLVIESMPRLKGGISMTTLQEAGAAIYTKAKQLAQDTTISIDYTQNDLCIIFKHLEDKLQISDSEKPTVTAPTGGYGDIYMKDTPCDSGIEPNPDGGPMWNSKDIWVRQNDDDELEHENGEYRTSGNPNYIYVRVRGRGCQEVIGAQLHVYWSKAGLKLEWDESWINFQVNGPNGVVLAGDELTDPINGISIPAIEPGEELIFKIPWVVPNPEDFDTDKHHFCLLARIVSTQDGMHVPEGEKVGTNARNNNNIAWKNLSIFEGDGFNEPPPVSVFVGCDSLSKNGKLKIVSTKLPLGKSIHDYGQVFLELREPLKTEWLNKGGHGAHFTLLPNGLIQVDQEGFELDSLPLVGCDSRIVDVHFLPDSNARDCSFDLIQCNDLGEVMGGERFEYVQTPEDNQGSFRTNPGESINLVNQVKLYPNPANERIHLYFPDDFPENIELMIYDTQGKILKKEIGKEGHFDEIFEIDISGYIPGLYFIQINDKGGEEIERLKFIKL